MKKRWRKIAVNMSGKVINEGLVVYLESGKQCIMRVFVSVINCLKAMLIV